MRLHAYYEGYALLKDVWSDGQLAHIMVPREDEAYRLRRARASDGRTALMVGQRVGVGRVREETLTELRTDLLGAFERSGSDRRGRGFRPISPGHWIDRDTGAPRPTSPDTPARLDADRLAQTADLLVLAMEVVGFAGPEWPAGAGRLRTYLRPAFEVVAGRELCSSGWLSTPPDECLFSVGYAFAPRKLRRSPYPYGPGAFELATKTFEFIRRPDGDVEVRMMAMMYPTLTQQMGMLGPAVRALTLERATVAVHADIHRHAVRVAASGHP